MSQYIFAGGLSWREYLQAKSFENSINGQIAETSKTIIASNEQLHRENISVVEGLNAALSEGIDQISSRISDGFAEISWKLNDISSGIKEINSTLQWGLGGIFVSLGRVNDTLEELLRTSQTPEQTWAREQFNEARRAFLRGWHEESLQYINRALNGYGPHSGYDLDYRFHYLHGAIRLGDAKNNSSEIIDLALAEKSFLISARYSECDAAQEAARALLAAGWAAYCQGKIREAENHTQRAIALFPEFAEAHFQIAKIRMHDHRPSVALASLAIAIQQDRGYSLKSSMDGDFQQHQQDLDYFLESLRQNVKTSAKVKLRDALQRIDALDSIAIESYRTSTDLLRKKIDEVQTEMLSETFYGFLNAIDLLEDVPALVDQSMKEFRARAEEDLNDKINKCNAAKSEAENEISKAKSHSTMEFCSGFGFIAFVIMSIASWISCVEKSSAINVDPLRLFFRGAPALFVHLLYATIGVAVIHLLYYRLLIINPEKQTVNDMVKERTRLESLKSEIQNLHV